MGSSYTDLQIYRSCPRLFAFGKLGYYVPWISEPIHTGAFVHAGISAHLKGGSTSIAVEAQAGKIQFKMDDSQLEELHHSVDRALKLLKRYIPNWLKDFTPIDVEPLLEHNGVICHPDLIALLEKQLTVVDFKTSHNPDTRWYDVCGQDDLYSYVYDIIRQPKQITAIAYDIISDKGIYRHRRLPRLRSGQRLFHDIQELNNIVQSVEQMEKQIQVPHIRYGAFLEEPHFEFTCPSRCLFFEPCWLLETADWEACHDYLEENYLK